MSTEKATIQEMLDALEEDAQAFTKKEIVAACEGVVDLSPADARLAKGQLIELVRLRLEEDSDIVELPGSQPEPEDEDEDEELESPDEPVATPIATPTKPPVVVGEVKPELQMVEVFALKTAAPRVGPTICKLLANTTCKVPQHAVEFLRERRLIK